MDMKINASLIVENRKQKAWSQQHLADVSGLSLRTVQRIENNSVASQDSVKAIAIAFGLIPADLMEVELNPQPAEQPSPPAVRNKRQSVIIPISIAATISLGVSIWFTAASYQRSNDASTMAEQQGQQNDAVNQAALTLLSVIDKYDYVASWQKSSGFFKSQLTEIQWAKALESVRTPLGKVISRQVTSQQLTSTLPSLPEGEYAILTLATDFTHKPKSIETLTVSRLDGEWQLLGYFIR